MEEDFYYFAKKIWMPLEVSLAPEFLDRHYEDNIFKALVDKYEGKCLSELGYILKVLKTGKMISDEIGSIMPSVLVVMEVQLMVFLPTRGMRLTVSIDIIFNHGIFANRDKVRILVPMTFLKDWNVHKDFTSHKLIHEKEGTILKQGAKITIELQEVRYEKDGYSCIGSLIR